MTKLKNDKIRQVVREQYGKVAQSGNPGCGCSATSCCGDSEIDLKATSKAIGYSDKEVSQVPQGANMGLGCGNPRAIASLKKGETVLDLGAGGGFDAFLAAEQVGDSGFVIGVDMTTEMVNKARLNAEKSHYANMEFRLGEIENLPVADGGVDVIISNCVINLSPEKEKVFREAFRVLKPGGRLAISDVVAFGEIPDQIKKDMALYTGCVAGASSIGNIEQMLKEAGFEEILVQPKGDSRPVIEKWTPESKIEDFVISATIEAVKPGS